MKKTIPDYKKIYTEMIREKFPHKAAQCSSILKKKKFSVMDIIHLNAIISSGSANQKYKSYDRAAVFEILDYQKKHKMNNISAARHFRISRNTLCNWKKKFTV